MPSNDTIEIQSLPASLAPLIEHFNIHADKLRLLSVLSPMCPK
jgi:hypothetical protein